MLSLTTKADHSSDLKYGLEHCIYRGICGKIQIKQDTVIKIYNVELEIWTPNIKSIKVINN